MYFKLQNKKQLFSQKISNKYFKKLSLSETVRHYASPRDYKPSPGDHESPEDYTVGTCRKTPGITKPGFTIPVRYAPPGYHLSNSGRPPDRTGGTFPRNHTTSASPGSLPALRRTAQNLDKIAIFANETFSKSFTKKFH